MSSLLFLLDDFLILEICISRMAGWFSVISTNNQQIIHPLFILADEANKKFLTYLRFLQFSILFRCKDQGLLTVNVLTVPGSMLLWSGQILNFLLMLFGRWKNVCSHNPLMQIVCRTWSTHHTYLSDLKSMCVECTSSTIVCSTKFTNPKKCLDSCDLIQYIHIFTFEIGIQSDGVFDHVLAFKILIARSWAYSWRVRVNYILCYLIKWYYLLLLREKLQQHIKRQNHILD